MQNARAKALIITNYCGLSSLVKPDAVTSSLCSCVKMYSWLIKQYESMLQLSFDTSTKIKFEALSAPEFWIYIKKTVGALTTGHRGVTTF
jgi:hypothetical protein